MYSDFDIKGKIALVTGASSGLGRHFAQLLAGAGANVVLAARRIDRLEQLADEIRSSGGRALPVAMDVTDADQIEAALHACCDYFGGPAGIIVNNSGVSREAFFTEMSEDDFDFVMDTNVKGVFLVARRFARALTEAGQPGSIINIASVAGLRVGQTMSAYCASKAACEQMTRAMALEMARYQIRVNAIAPGYFRTEINSDFLDSEAGEKMRKRIPVRRFGQYQELSGPLLLLASDAGSFMTGATLVVDGGHMWSSL